MQRIGTMEEVLNLNKPPKCTDSTYIPQMISPRGGDDDDGDEESRDMPVVERRVIESIYRDDESALVTHSKKLSETYSEPFDRSITSKLLQLCCMFDSVECASALLGGDVGVMPLTNEMDETGKSPLHTAAESHAARCVELLLKKRARTDLRTKDSRAQLPLELSLSTTRMDAIWNPEDYSIEDLVVFLGQKDLSAIRLLGEKTKEVAEVACAKAVEGRIVALAALLIVAAEKINDSIVELRDADSGSKEKLTIYECVVREALSLGSATSSLETEKRKFLLSEIELLHLFGVVSQSRCTDKKVKSPSPLVRAVQAGDEAVITLLLKASIGIDDVDVEGNSALHWCLKASKTPSLPEIKILLLLLKHGARVTQKNKLGLTALHMAAANGNTLAVQILLLEDPDGINYKTETKETPLFFAVKNDHMDCAELLLRWGANSEVLNLRRQRPIDLAKSQDMRFMLNPTNIGLMNRNFPIQQKLAALLQDDEVLLNAYETLLSMTDEETNSERGGKCFYAHCEEERRHVKQGTHFDRSPSAMELKRRIFVGGLPPLLTSDSLRKFFDEHFGAVEDARVLVTQTENHIHSRGFGFVTFRDVKSVSAALQAHYVTIMDKRVEIKGIIPKYHLVNESKKLSPQRDGQERNDKSHPQAQMFNETILKEDKPQQRPWVNKLLPGKIMPCATEAQSHAKTAFEDQRMPIWLRIFKKWLPSFLQDMSKHPREGEYALSSLKGDFRAKFGLELDHTSLGYSKLSDFMRCFSDLCSMKVVPIGRRGSPNHMVLSPKFPMLQQQLRPMPTMLLVTPFSVKAIVDGSDSNRSRDSTCSFEDLTSRSNTGSCGNVGLRGSCIVKENPSIGFSVNPRFLQFLKQDSLFHTRPWLQKEYNTGEGNSNNDLGGYKGGNKWSNLRHQQRHLVLQSLSRCRKNPSVYFLREFDFYSNYKLSVMEGKCFACQQHEVLWANMPCKHLLWCADCKVQASLAARSLTHKCVVCDVEVQKIDLLPCQESCQLVGEYITHVEFPPFNPKHIQSPPKKTTSDSVGCYN